MHHGIRDTLAYHRDQRQTWLAVRDKFHEPKPQAQGRTVRQAPRPLPPTRGVVLWRASAGLRGQLRHGACVLGVGILSLGVLVGLGIGFSYVMGLLPSLLRSSASPGHLILPDMNTSITAAPSQAVQQAISLALIIPGILGVSLAGVQSCHRIALVFAAGTTYLLLNFLGIL